LVANVAKVFEGCKSPKEEDVKSETDTKYASCPKDAAGIECGGSTKGRCDTKSVKFGAETSEVKECVCIDEAKFTGESCDIAKETYVAEAVKEDKKKEEAVMMKKNVTEIVKRRKEACTTPGQVQCPDLENMGAFRKACVWNSVQCYSLASDPEKEAVDSKRTLCETEQTATTKNRALIKDCAELLAPIEAPPLEALLPCDGERKLDGSCDEAAYEADYYTDSSFAMIDRPALLAQATEILCTDASMPILCTDGRTCRADSTKCAAAVPYDGCPLGTVACPGREDTCVSSKAKCEERVGCTDGMQFCGFDRVDTGSAKLSSTFARPEPICKAQCKFNVSTTVTPQEFAVDRAEIAAEITASGSKIFECKGEGSTRPAMRMKMRSSTALQKKSDSEADVAITISPVDDSYKQHGPFSNFIDRATVLSPTVSIEPSSDVDVELGSLELCFAINDEFANTDEAKCGAVLGGASVYYVSTATDLTVTPTKYANCAVDYSTDGGCFCCTEATHFSVYTVVDESTTAAVKDAEAAVATAAASDVDTERGVTAGDDASATDDAASAAADTSGDDTGTETTDPATDSGGGALGAIIGGVVGGLALIAVVALLVVRKSQANSAGQSEAYKEKAIQQPGERAPSIDVNEDFRNPMQDEADEM
jgi:hypothetical protein